uniref:Protochlorophyllide reductase n=1 Tax=Chaetoceros debilis TaxID=122233 RepID=A0A7S3PUV6_9STRA|mmetsp:Transcript_14/g.30  ORF Transcript_14/g.30 Transcript_14/m.30 type:complete len:272 (+) Transcript_14:93-908(+)
MRILVTGANQGIGFALSRQLVIEHNCHVILTARSPEKGMNAVAQISESMAKTSGCSGSIEFLPLDVSNDSSVKEARSKLDNTKLDGIVNNAGIGLNTGMTGDILNTNLYGTKRVCESFLDLLDEEKGRIINLGSGSGPMYTGGCSAEDKRYLCSPQDCTWDWIQNHAETRNNGSDSYGLSKSLVACYTGVLAREHPNILSSCVTPGFIDTQMTAGWGASKSPDQGTLPMKHCLFEDLEGNGWYYGSDAKRSPYHFMRSPGEPVYDGVNPFI